MISTTVRNPASSEAEILSVCSHCFRIQTRDGHWEGRYCPSDEPVTHGICGECFVKFYPDLLRPRVKR
jgi:hypothetical protein